MRQCVRRRPHPGCLSRGGLVLPYKPKPLETCLEGLEERVLGWKDAQNNTAELTRRELPPPPGGWEVRDH